MQAQRVHASTDPLIPDLGAGRKRVVSLTPRSFRHWGRARGTLRTKGWLDLLEKK
jgi:hypothetical protein